MGVKASKVVEKASRQEFILCTSPQMWQSTPSMGVKASKVVEKASRQEFILCTSPQMWQSTPTKTASSSSASMNASSSRTQARVLLASCSASCTFLGQRNEKPESS